VILGDTVPPGETPDPDGRTPAVVIPGDTVAPGETPCPDGRTAAVASYTAVNRDGWNEIAADRHAKSAQFFLAGGCTLDDFELGFLPDVRGKSLLHLACANGNDSLSLAAVGARVTGVDISDVAVKIAQRTADEAGLDARFIAADVYDLPADLGQFDIVYMSWGGICWMPGLRRWAGIIAAHLKPGATLGVFEHHPIWEILAVRDGKLALVGDYFGRAPRDQRHTDPAKRPTGFKAGAELTSFVWPVSDVLTALSTAGLVIDRFTEGAEASMWGGLGAEATWLPAYYVIVASKPD
jgi:SAM-dependent methyltransferase